jgi:hypothetical protein
MFDLVGGVWNLNRFPSYRCRMCRIEFNDRNLILLRFVFGFWFRGDGESIRVVEALKKQIAAIGELLYQQVNK